MIAVEDLKCATAPLTGPSMLVAGLTEEDAAAVDYLDAKIEPVALQLKDDMFHVVVSLKQFSTAIIVALKKRWEVGGWTVGVFQRPDDSVQVIFVKPRTTTALSTKVVAASLEKREQAPATNGVLPAVVLTRAPKMSTPLLVRMPTRARPVQALRVLAAYRQMATTPVAIEVVIDEDDDTMNNSMVLQQLYDLDCVITVGRHKNKIDAVNAGQVDDWAILVLASDDMVPVQEGYDLKIIRAMEKHFPLFDGAICFNDGYNKDHVRDNGPVLCTLPVMGRHLVDAFGGVYHDGYGSLYCDDEQTQILTAMRRLVFVDDVIIEHRHHAASKAAHDALYKFNDNKFSEKDKALFDSRSELRRPGSQFAFDAPPLLLSILVCSTTARADKLEKLEKYLRGQMREFPREVELCVAVDAGEMSIGEKRQQLLECAVGTHVAFVDDDDWVDCRYVARILDALKSRPDVDCCSLVGAMTTDGDKPERFEHSLKHYGWYTREDGVYIRTPNHLNAVKREHALKVGFQPKNHGEDFEFSKAVLKFLKVEVSTGETVPLYHYWARSKERA